jgi:hypothetical protein
MHDFLLDLWQDLRDKRMWPIAAVLAIALLAIPVVLAKPASSPKSSAAPRPAVSGRDANALKVQLADVQDGKGSALDRFPENNPFLPPGKLVKELKATSATASSTATTSSGSSLGSGGESPGGATPGVATGGGGGSTPVAPTTGGGGRGKPRVTKYAYVADVTFWTNGRRRAYHGMRRLRMLPSEQSPFLLFLGVDSSGENAVFLVDSTLTASGEGRCSPTGKECAVLSLGPGSEEDFTTADGQFFTLRIDEVRRVRLSRTARARDSARRRHRRRPRAHPAPPTRRFVLPSLTDLVTVASAGGRPSSSSAGSR